MRCTQLSVAALAIAVAMPAPLRAQVITQYVVNGPRVGLTAGYGGRGLDVEASLDSPRLLDFFSVRGAIGSGRWVNWDNAHPPGGAPRVTRVSATAILTLMPYRGEIVRPYIGAGYAGYFPHGTHLNRQDGVHIVLGMEGSGDRWSFGPELEFDFPDHRVDGRYGGEGDGSGVRRNHLLPTARIGFAVRRSF